MKTFFVCADAQDGFEPFKQREILPLSWGWISVKLRGCVTKQVGLSTIGVGILKNVVFRVI